MKKLPGFVVLTGMVLATLSANPADAIDPNWELSITYTLDGSGQPVSNVLVGTLTHAIRCNGAWTVPVNTTSSDPLGLHTLQFRIDTVARVAGVILKEGGTTREVRYECANGTREMPIAPAGGADATCGEGWLLEPRQGEVYPCGSGWTYFGFGWDECDYLQNCEGNPSQPFTGSIWMAGHYYTCPPCLWTLNSIYETDFYVAGFPAILNIDSCSWYGSCPWFPNSDWTLRFTRGGEDIEEFLNFAVRVLPTDAIGHYNAWAVLTAP